MNNFLKYIGVILVLVGVLVIAIPAFTTGTTNLTLVIGIILEIVGFALHIILTRAVMSKEASK